MNKVNKNQNTPDEQSRIEQNDELDTETTFADMTVEGMPWHRPERHEGGQDTQIPQLSKSERHALVRGALLAALPLVGVLLLVMVLLFGLACLWLS